MAKSKKKFKTEVQQLLDLVIHSLYSNREIFLRELISNASDAIDRARFEGLSNKAITEPEGGWRIHMTPDQDAGTLMLSDNGIGMTRDEVEQNIGTIANSGTKAFMQQMQSEEFKDHPELIGQFGVGFYSSFMVADAVTVITKRAGDESPAVKWHSTGDGTFTIEETEKATPGTDIILHVGEDHKEFMDEWKIRQIVKKYSDYVAFPVTMDIHREEQPKDDEGKPIEGAEAVKTTETETLNSMQAIWTRAKKDIKEEEYNEFYKAISHDFADPAETIHWKAEGALEFNALLYLPSRAPFDLFHNMEPKGIHLYVKRVFIMNDCKDLLPPYLRFVAGVVDSSDLPLNVSREILQEDLLVKKISKNLVSKVLGALKDMKEKRPKDYQAFYQELGKVLKEGLHSDYANKEKLQDLVLYTSSKSDELTALKDYVARMHPDQKEIYYLAGDNHDAVSNSPHLEAFKKKDYEVLFMTDPIDEFVAQSLTEYDGKPLKAIDHGDVSLLNEEEKEEQEKTREASQEKFGDLLKALGERLDEEVEEVRLSDRLTESACCLVAPQNGMNAHMERIMQSMGQELPKSKRILELNPEHPVMETMLGIYAADEKNARLDDYAELLYSQGLITEGSAVKNPLRFTKLVSELMVAGEK